MPYTLHRGRGAKSGGLECWTSAVEAEVWRTGQLVSKRMDVLVSRDFRVSKGTARLCHHTILLHVLLRTTWLCQALI